MTPRILPLTAALPAALLAILPAGVSPAVQAADSADLRRTAGEVQARFERQRRRLANPTPAGYRGECDVTVGRMCLRFGPGDDWWPEPDPPELREARDTLLVRLARIAARIPGDGWVSGQRVAYLAEVHRLDAALEVAEACTSREPGWCDGLRGLVLHRQGRFPDAEKAFRLMLSALDTARAREWTDPSLLLDGAGREVLEAAGEEVRERLEETAWRWSDPLFLAPGNDRWTEHLARRVLDGVRRDAANPYHLSWGEDLSETLLRYGAEYGWERVDPSPAMMTTVTSMRGQEHPQLRSYMPPGRALDRVEDPPADAWNPSARAEPRTGYAPAYAPVLLPARGRFFRFPRGDTLVVVAWLGLPADTSVHAGHDHPPLRETLRWRGRPAALGLFADPPADADPDRPDRREPQGRRARVRTGVPEGALRLVLPPGRYLLSGEVWAPDSARAGRIRQGVVWEGVPRDVATLSDLLLLSEPLPPRDAGSPPSLEGILPLVREGPVHPGDTLAVAWELTGRGRGAGPVRYRLEVRRREDGLLGRAGRLLGLLGDAPGVELAWTGEGEGEPPLRVTGLILPADLEPGRYDLRLRVELPGRDPLERSRQLRVAPPSR